jgi:hypothetical protein
MKRTIFFSDKYPAGLTCDVWFMYSSRVINLPLGCLSKWFYQILL